MPTKTRKLTINQKNFVEFIKGIVGRLRRFRAIEKVLEENGFKQNIGDLCVNGLSGSNILTELILLRDHNQRTCFGRSHFLTGLHDVVNVEIYGIVDLQPPEQKSFALIPDEPGIPHHEEKLSDFRLEDNDQGNSPHTDKLPQYLGEKLHL